MKSKEISNVKLKTGVIAIIDVLGSSEKDNSQLEEVMEALLEASALHTSSQDDRGNLTFYDNANVFIVGDAVWISQKADSKQSGLDVVASAIAVSAELFGRNIPHRAILHIGEYQSKFYQQTNVPPYLMGRAVVEAVALEKQVKAVGICLSKEITNQASKWYQEPGLKDIWYSRTFGGKVFVSRTDSPHLQTWKKFVQENRMNHPYIAAAHTMLNID